MLSQFSDILKVLLQVAQVVALVYACYRFTQKPHDTLETRVRELEKRVDSDEVKMSDIQKSLDSAHEKHRQQHDTNEMFITVVLSFIDFEIAFCTQTEYTNTDDLLKAKQTLQKYLARK